MAPNAYKVGTSARAKAKMQTRTVESVNALRGAVGLPLVVHDEALAQAAFAHAFDMSNQARPWHFGSDGSSPLDRVHATGYAGRFVGELISETFESESDTLAAWIGDTPSKDILMDPSATKIGLGWYQEQNGKIWWTLEIGGI
jgi:uncharacterized protein YkwD